MKKFILVLLIAFIGACSTQETTNSGNEPIILSPEDKEFIENIKGRSQFGQNTVEVDSSGNITQNIDGETTITHYFYKSNSDTQAVYTFNNTTRSAEYVGIDFEDDFSGERKINEYGRNQNWSAPNKVGWTLDDKTFMPDAFDLEFIKENTQTYSFGGKNYRIEQNTGHIYDNIGKIIYYFIEAKDNTHAIYAQSEGEYIGVRIENDKFYVYKDQGNSFWKNIFDVDWLMSNQVDEKDLIFIFESQGNVDFGNQKYSIRRDGNIYNQIGELIFYFIKANNNTQAIYAEDEYAYIGIQLDNKNLSIFKEDGKYAWGTVNQVSWDPLHEYVDTSAEYIPNAIGGYTFLGTDYRIKSDGHIYNDIDQIVYRFIEAKDSSIAIYAKNSGEYLGIQISTTGSSKTFDMYKKNRLQFWTRVADVSFREYHKLLISIPEFINNNKGSHIFDDEMVVIEDTSELSIGNIQYIFVKQIDTTKAIYKTVTSDREFFGVTVNNQIMSLYKQNKTTYWTEPSQVSFESTHQEQISILKFIKNNVGSYIFDEKYIIIKDDGILHIDGIKYIFAKQINPSKAIYKTMSSDTEFFGVAVNNKTISLFKQNKTSYWIDPSLVEFEVTHQVQERSLSGQDKTYNDVLRASIILKGYKQIFISSLGSIFINGRKGYVLQKFISQHKALYICINGYTDDEIYGVEYMTEINGNKVAVFFDEEFRSTTYNPFTRAASAFVKNYRNQTITVDGSEYIIKVDYNSIALKPIIENLNWYYVIGVRSENQIIVQDTSWNLARSFGLEFSEQVVSLFGNSSKQWSEYMDDITWNDSGKMRLWNARERNFYQQDDDKINSFSIDQQDYKILDIETGYEQNTLYYIVNGQKELIGEHKGYIMSDNGVLYFITVEYDKYVINIKNNYSSHIFSIGTGIRYYGGFRPVKLKIDNNNLYMFTSHYQFGSSFLKYDRTAGIRKKKHYQMANILMP